MRYQGGKHRIAKHLMRAIRLHLHSKGVRNLHELTFVEPFCGGANMTACAAPYFKQVLAYDANPYIVAMWQEATNGWFPPEVITEDEYHDALKRYRSQDYSHLHLDGFILVGCSFGGKFAAGYGRDKRMVRNIAEEARRSIFRQVQSMCNVNFQHNVYLDIQTPSQSVVYCDPPYANTTGYKFGRFDSEKFWQWASELSKDNYVFVSEATAPAPYRAIWGQSIQNAIAKSKAMTERLFVLDDSTAKA